MKKMFLFITCLIYGAGLLESCSLKEDTVKLEVRTVHTFRLSEETQEYLHQMYTTVMDNPAAQELAFSNFITKPIGIVITDYNGQFKQKVGKEGRGPGELQSARYLGFNSAGNIVVLDKISAFFNEYDRSTEEVISYDYPIKQGISITSRNLETCEEKWYLAIQMLGKPILEDTPTVAVFDDNFSLINTLGGYDPFFQGRRGIMHETEISVDCKEGLIFTTQSKIPYIQVFSMENGELLGRTKQPPPSFMLSDKFITMVNDHKEWTRYMSEEQSLSMRLAQTEKYIYHIFRNEKNIYTQPKRFNESDHFVAVYDKKKLTFLGELKLPGAILGSTKEGNLIMLSNEDSMEIQFIEIKAKENAGEDTIN